MHQSPDSEMPAQYSGLVRRAFGNASLLMSGVVLMAILIVAIAAPLLAPFDPYAHDLSRRLLPPILFDGHNTAHPLGTDAFGRDYLSRLLYGARISLIIGISVMLVSGLIGTTLGLIAGYFGGRVDQVIMFVINTRLALPIFLVAMSVVVVFGPSITGTILTISLFLWDRFAVVVRSATQQAVSQDYVLAARSIGCSTRHILARRNSPEPHQCDHCDRHDRDGFCHSHRGGLVVSWLWYSRADTILGTHAGPSPAVPLFRLLAALYPGCSAFHLGACDQPVR